MLALIFYYLILIEDPPHTFSFLVKLTQLERNLTSDNGLFFYNAEGELVVNSDKATEMTIIHENNSNHIEFRPIVVPSKDSNNNKSS